VLVLRKMELPHTFGEIKERQVAFREEFRKQVSAYILAGFGLVVGLAWNEAIKSFIEYLFPLAKDTLLARFIYAALITVFVVFISVYILKPSSPKENKP